jgi:hypothetical protein
MEIRDMSKMRVLGAVVLLFALAACDEGTPFSPTPPGPPTTVEFSGELSRGSVAVRDFTPQFGGTVTATLTSLPGNEDFVVSFALGNWFGGACSLVFANDSARQGAVLTGTLSQGGPLCVRIAEVGHIPEGATVPFTIEVVHP